VAQFTVHLSCTAGINLHQINFLGKRVQLKSLCYELSTTYSETPTDLRTLRGELVALSFGRSSRRACTVIAML
jgi:hypothetical protein